VRKGERAVIRRDTFTTTPPSGDYVLSTTGLTWSIDRTSPDGVVMRIVAGERTKKGALARLLMLAEGDRADAWETFGTGSYRLIKRCRVAS
jgi:hypothetical protein